ncbi:MAG: hypothetical protein H6733_13950 [Alphaproteobacteria bacterium]|nr:hypothetical protein [Alphaproteobacteria bacterium]
MTATLEHDLAGDTPPLWLTRLAALAAPPVLALAWLASGGAFTADGDVAYKALPRGRAAGQRRRPHGARRSSSATRRPTSRSLPDLLQRRLHTDAPPLMLTIPSSNLVALVPLLQTLVFDPGHTPSVAGGADVVDPPAPDRPSGRARARGLRAPELALPLPPSTPSSTARSSPTPRGTRRAPVDAAAPVTARRHRAHAPGQMVPGDADERMERAASHVLGDQGDMDRRTARMIPVVEAGRSATSGAAAGALDATLVPELVDLVRSHGADLVVVGLPQARNDMAATAADERRGPSGFRRARRGLTST